MHSQAELNRVARRLSQQPRENLGFTPAGKLSASVGSIPGARRQICSVSNYFATAPTCEQRREWRLVNFCRVKVRFFAGWLVVLALNLCTTAHRRNAMRAAILENHDSHICLKLFSLSAATGGIQ